MTTLSFPELEEIEGKIANRLKSGGDFTNEAKADDGILDLRRVKSVPGTSIEKAEWFKKLQDELSDLNDQATPLRAIKAAAEKVDIAGPAADTGDGSKRDDQEAKTLGDIIANDKRRLEKGKEWDVDVDLKTTLLTSAGWLPQAVRTDRMVAFATRPPTILDFIPTVTTDQISVVYMEETTFTNAAVEVTEGAAKPAATLVYTERTLTARKIAVFLPVSDEQLEDVPRMKALIDNRLSFMVRQRLASQILVGDGIAPNIKGLLNTAGINTQAKGADPTPDAIYKGMVLCMTVGFAMPDLAIFNALDWQDVKLLRTADGLYIWGNPSDAGPDRIWGLPVVIEQGLTQNTAVVGAFREFAELDIKKGLTVETGYNNDDWTKNLQTVRAEMRAVPVFYRPSAFTQVTGV